MTSRELPFAEWGRLPAGTELADVRAVLPDSVRIFVVEDEAGQIIGAWSLMIMLHAEGIWIAPQHRGRGAVARRLLTAMRGAIAGLGLTSALTGGEPAIVALLKKLGAAPLPFPLYVWRAVKEKSATL